MLLRRVARPMLAAIFIQGGIAALKSPQGHVQAAKPVLDAVTPVLEKATDAAAPTIDKAAEAAPVDLPHTTTDWLDDETLVKIDGGREGRRGHDAGAGQVPAAGLDGARRLPDPDDAGRAPLLGGDRPRGQADAADPLLQERRPARRPADRGGRHRGQAVARLARPQGRQARRGRRRDPGRRGVGDRRRGQRQGLRGGARPVRQGQRAPPTTCRAA